LMNDLVLTNVELVEQGRRFVRRLVQAYVLTERCDVRKIGSVATKIQPMSAEVALGKTKERRFSGWFLRCRPGLSTGLFGSFRLCGNRGRGLRALPTDHPPDGETHVIRPRQPWKRSRIMRSYTRRCGAC
jgi:hypothetical protein